MRACGLCSTGSGRRSSRISREAGRLKSEHGASLRGACVPCQPLAGMAVTAPVWARFLSIFPDVQLEGPQLDEALVGHRGEGGDDGYRSKFQAAADMIGRRVMDR